MKHVIRFKGFFDLFLATALINQKEGEKDEAFSQRTILDNAHYCFKLKYLFDKNVITQEEYDPKKSMILESP